MGVTIPPYPPEREYGADCLPCFEPGLTPNPIFVSFSGVELCPDQEWPGDSDLNTTWPLTQYGGDPCTWEYDDANWRIIYQANYEGWCSLGAWNSFWDCYFYGFWGDRACELFYNNQNICGGSIKTTKGQGLAS
jgi:hypothetical protein